MKKHNKITYVIAILLIVILSTTVIPSLFKHNEVLGYTYTDTTTNLTWYFTISGNKAYNLYLYSGTLSGDTLVIPSKVTYNGKEYEVAGIRGYSTSTSTSSSYRQHILYNATRSTNNYTIKTVVIPETVTSIGNNTFCNFYGLENIVIPNNVQSVGSYAFYQCTAVESLSLGTGVQSIGTYAFTNCRQISGKISIPNSTTYLGTYAFYGCLQIEEVIIGTGVTTINERTFMNCNKLAKITMPNVSTIGTYAFSNSGIQGDYTIPNTVTTIGDNAFSNCSNLENINIGKKVSSIGKNAFLNSVKLANIIVDENNANYSSLDGILFNKDKTILIFCPRVNSKTNYVIPNTVKEISASAFFYCKNIVGTITLSENLETIGDSAFYNCSKIKGKLIIPNSVTSINNSVFYSCTGIEGIQLSENLQTIGTSAFYRCSNLKGDLIIPNSVISIGNSAFSDCSSFDGILQIGTGMTTIANNTFRNSGNFYKTIISNTIKTINYEAFTGFKDLWIDNEAANVSLNSQYAGQNATTFVHWAGCSHKLQISILPGIEIINTDTLQPIISGEYECETSMNYKIQIKDGYNYNNLKLVTINNNNYNTALSEDLNISKTYELPRLTRDCSIYVQDILPQPDFKVKTYITEVNRIKVGDSREPVVKIENGEIVYKKLEDACQVKTGDLITCKIRVYNQGILNGTPDTIKLIIPEGLKLVENNRTNEINGWEVAENGEIISAILKNKIIEGYNGTSEIKFEEIEVLLEVTAEKPKEQEEIHEIKVKIAQEEDIEKIVLSGQVKVDYTININKIDGDTKELLAGAEFALKDEQGNILRQSKTDDNGTLSFGLISTYGEGQDIYYIEEIGAPEGYVMVKQTQIKVTVTKTITNEEQGSYSVNVICEVLDYNVDTTRYEYTPIKTKEQLAKIGSGEIVTIDGIEYKYNTDTNYKLMNDIDLSGMEWIPIKNEIKGIIDGNGHKISNMTITSTEEYGITEVGLFRSFSGIIENLTLENVNIDIQAIDEEALTISGYPCVGAFAGYMVEGTIRNCKVTGNISAVTDNIGGFVGHTAPEYMVKIQNCTNSANVTGKQGSAIREGYIYTVQSSNVGGLIGCALGTLTITDCTNTGNIINTNYNVGGLVGFIQSTDYKEVNIYADFDEADKVIELVVENRRTYGKYDIVLENIDATTLGLIEGGVYTILDKEKNILNGCENVKLENGRLQVATVDINNLGLDTYYVKEVKPAEGYEGLQGTVKLEVSRYWDKETQSYKVSVDTSVLTNKETNTDKPTINELPSSSATGNIFTKVNFENVSWNVNKAEIKNSTNTGTITSAYMNAGGILGTTYSVIEIDNCLNKGTIQTGEENNNKYSIGGKAGGIVSEIRTEGLNKFCKVTKCKNEGTVIEYGGLGALGGIVAHTIGDIEILNCENTGAITSTAYSGVGGILGDGLGHLIIEDCKNVGELKATADNMNSIVGGIVGKAYDYDSKQREKISVYINNCESVGNINSGSHTGGILGLTDGLDIQIKNCNVHDMTIEDINGDKGGIIGLLSTNNAKIENCNVDNVKLIKEEKNTYSTYGANGGIVGNACRYGASNLSTLEYIFISNCKVTNSQIIAQSHEAAGILGQSYGERGITNIYIYDCICSNNEIKNNNIQSSCTYTNAAGIFAAVYQGGNIIIENCLVEKTEIEADCKENRGYDQNVAGIFGIGMYCDSFKVKNCDVVDTTITNKAYVSDSCANAGGLIGGIGTVSNEENALEISKCNVINTDITTTAGNLGGIVGLHYEWTNTPRKISECTVSGGTFISTADTSSNTCTGGIGGMMCAALKVEKCTVDNMTIKGNGRNTSGLIALGYNDTEINDSKLINSNIENLGQTSSTSTLDCVSGIIAYAAQKAILNNNTVENCNIKGVKTVGNVAGICGALGSEIYANNCNVIKCNILSDLDYNVSSTNSTTTGMFGRLNSSAPCQIENCLLKQTIINGRGSCLAGIVSNGHYVNMNNCKVEDVEIYDNFEGLNANSSLNCYRAIGGLFGSLTNEVKVENCKIDNLKIQSKAKSVGGIGGYITTIKKLENCTVDNLNITNDLPNNVLYGSVAGIIADVNTIDCQIDNCKILNSELIGNSENIAGIIGASFALDEATISNCIVDTVELINENKYAIDQSTMSTYTADRGNVGGIIAFASNDIIIDECNVNNSNLALKQGKATNKHIGGIIGFSSNTTIQDSKVYNSKITNNTENGSIGGLAGNINYTYSYTPSTLTVNNSGIEKSIVNGNYRIGGILGFGKINSTKAYTTDSTINGNTLSAETGGIVGNGLKSSKIVNTNVTGSIITSKYRAAGIAGFAPFDISECNVTDSIITVNQEYGGEVAGIVSSAAETTSKIEKCNVIRTTITNNSNGFTGGIAAFANNTISECNVTNSNITSTGSSANGLGGIVGHGSNFTNTLTYIYKCIVSGCILTGNNGVGGIAGAGVANIEESSVIGEITEEVTLTGLELEQEEISQLGEENMDLEQEISKSEEVQTELQENLETEEQLQTAQEPIQTIVKKYTSKITGKNNVGGILGDAGGLYTGNTFTTLTNCTVKGTEITGQSKISEAIGRNSYYTENETTIYDKLNNFIKENCNIVIIEE